MKLMEVRRFTARLSTVAALVVMGGLASPTAASAEIAFGREMTNRDLLQAAREMEIAQALGLNVTRPWVPATKFGAMDPSASLGTYDWCRLIFEAHVKLPEATNPDAVDQFLKSKGVMPQKLEAVRDKYSASAEEVHRAVLNYLRIMSLAERASEADIEVDEEDVNEVIRLCGRRLASTIGVLEAKHVFDTVPPPTEEQLRAHYEKYVGVAADASPDGIGYLIRRQVVLDVVAVRVDELKERFQVADQEIEDYWQGHGDEFWVTDDGRKLGIGDEEEHELRNFRDAVTDVLKVVKIHAVARPALDSLLAELRKPFESAPQDPSGYKIAPPEVHSFEYLKELVARISKDAGIELEATRTELIPVTHLAQLPALGSARAVDHTGKRIAFEHLVRRAKGIATPPPTPGDGFALGIYEPCPAVLTNKHDGRDRDLFLYRVAEVRSDEPASFDAIQEQAATDWRWLRAYERAEHDAEIWVASAQRDGIEASWQTQHEIRSVYSEASRPQALEPFSRRKLSPPPVYQATNSMTFPTQLPGLAWVTSPIIDEIFHRADSLWGPKKEGEHVAFSVGSPKARVVAVVEISGILPEQAGDDKERMVRSMIAGTQVRERTRTWFDPANIRQRAGQQPPTE